MADASVVPTALKVEDLSVTFDTPRGDLLALDGLSLQVRPGESLGIVGESGSGKSVLARSVMNLLAPTATVSSEAKITVRDLNPATLTGERLKHFRGVEVAMIFQNPMTSLNPVKRIGVQIMDPLRYHLKLGREKAGERARQLLEYVGIPDPERCLRQYPHQLSGGMRQRVMIAIAISCNPKLLIADEPTTALDVTVQRQILDLLQQLQRDTGMALVMITHDLGVVAGRTDRINVMYAGQVVEAASTEEIFRQPRHPYTQALMQAIPRLEDPSQTPLQPIHGRPPDMVEPPQGCRFAARCPLAQPQCLQTAPPLEVAADGQRSWRCFFPIGTPAGAEALRRNVAAGSSAAGLPVTGGVAGVSPRPVEGADQVIWEGEEK